LGGEGIEKNRREEKWKRKRRKIDWEEEERRSGWKKSINRRREEYSIIYNIIYIIV
jgi:hypothetical protein